MHYLNWTYIKECHINVWCTFKLGHWVSPTRVAWLSLSLRFKYYFLRKLKEQLKNLPKSFWYISGIFAWKGPKYRVFSGLYFPAFGLNMDRYSVSLRIQSNCAKVRAKKPPYLDTFHAVIGKQFDTGSICYWDKWKLFILLYLQNFFSKMTSNLLSIF